MEGLQTINPIYEKKMGNYHLGLQTIHKDEPAPTSLFPGAGYHTVMEAFGGKGYLVGTPQELQSALTEAFSKRNPAVINVTIDPYAGAESGRMQHKN